MSVSRQLGHSSPDITLKVYAHLFDHARHAERTRALMEAEFGGLLDAPELARSGVVKVLED